LRQKKVSRKIVQKRPERGGTDEPCRNDQYGLLGLKKPKPTTGGGGGKAREKAEQQMGSSRWKELCEREGNHPGPQRHRTRNSQEGKTKIKGEHWGGWSFIIPLGYQLKEKTTVKKKSKRGEVNRE